MEGVSIRHESGGGFLVVPLPFFCSKSAISRFGERFRDGQYSLVSFLFADLLLTVPRAQPFAKVGARAPVPYEVGATGPIESYTEYT